jgi:twitching motility protein PilT
MTYETSSYTTISDIDDDPSVEIDEHKIINALNEYDTEELFRYAVSQGCSDIHLKPGSPPKLRIHGELLPIQGLRRLTSVDTDLIRQDVMSDADQGSFVNRVYDHVFAYELVSVARFRMIVTKSMGMITLNARKLVDTPPSFEDLGTPATIRDLANFTSGLILVAGITGSGKSTLMAAMIREINATKNLNIISIEDPVEILHSDIKSNIIQRNIGTDLLTFTDGVRDAMRQDPDVILIGEIRDKETAQAALKAAETGHLVISTIHSMSSVSVIGTFLDRLEGEGSAGARNRLADVLRGVVVQKLVRSTAENGQLVPVNEILLNTDEVKRAIEAEAAPTKLREILEAGRETGMQTFEQDFQQLVAANIVTEQVAIAQATDKMQMKELIEELKPRTEVNPAFPQAPKPVAPVLKPAVKTRPFSEVIRQKEEDSGVVVKPSSAAPDTLPKPIRPNIYVPRG